MCALELLHYLAAIDDEGKITALGSLVASFHRPTSQSVYECGVVQDNILTVYSSLQKCWL